MGGRGGAGERDGLDVRARRVTSPEDYRLEPGGLGVAAGAVREGSQLETCKGRARRIGENRGSEERLQPATLFNAVTSGLPGLYIRSRSLIPRIPRRLPHSQ